MFQSYMNGHFRKRQGFELWESMIFGVTEIYILQFIRIYRAQVSALHRPSEAGCQLDKEEIWKGLRWTSENIPWPRLFEAVGVSHPIRIPVPLWEPGWVHWSGALHTNKISVSGTYISAAFSLPLSSPVFERTLLDIQISVGVIQALQTTITLTWRYGDDVESLCIAIYNHRFVHLVVFEKVSGHPVRHD